MTFSRACKSSMAFKLLLAGLWARWFTGRPALNSPSNRRAPWWGGHPQLCLAPLTPSVFNSQHLASNHTSCSPCHLTLAALQPWWLDRISAFLFQFGIVSLVLQAHSHWGPDHSPLLPPLSQPCHYTPGRPAFIFCLVLVEEKSSGFRLKPPTLIHGQAPSAGRCPPALVGSGIAFSYPSRPLCSVCLHSCLRQPHQCTLGCYLTLEPWKAALKSLSDQGASPTCQPFAALKCRWQGNRLGLV